MGWFQSGSILPKESARVKGETTTYRVHMIVALRNAIQKQFGDRRGHIFELAKRLETVRLPEFSTDLDIELVSHFCGQAVIVRDLLGPLVSDKIQIVGFVSDTLGHVLIVNLYTNWDLISQHDLDVYALEFAKYESKLLSLQRKSKK